MSINMDDEDEEPDLVSKRPAKRRRMSTSTRGRGRGKSSTSTSTSTSRNQIMTSSDLEHDSAPMIFTWTNKQNFLFPGLKGVIQKYSLVNRPATNPVFQWSDYILCDDLHRYEMMSTKQRRIPKKTANVITVLTPDNKVEDSKRLVHAHVPSVHTASFVQMEKNMSAMMQFILFPENRIAAHEEQIKKAKDMIASPLNGDVDNIRKRQHAQLILQREEEAVRVIRTGVERKTFEDRLVQFWETWNHLPLERRQNEDQFMNLYSQHFQPMETIPEVTTRRHCPRCKVPYSNNRRESDLECKVCGSYKTYITLKTAVRIYHKSKDVAGTTSESKLWTKFTNHSPFFISDECPITDEMKSTILSKISARDACKPLVGHIIKPASIKSILIEMDCKELCVWTPRLIMEFNSDISAQPTFMTRGEHDYIIGRMKYIQDIFNAYRNKYGLELCDPRYAFRRICLKFFWKHLLDLFPIEESTEESIKWENLISFVSISDSVTDWKEKQPESDTAVVPLTVVGSAATASSSIVSK